MPTYTDVFGGQTVPPAEEKYRAVTLSANTQLYFPSTSDTSDTLAAILDVSATSGGLNLILPDATSSSVGYDALIRNVGANTFSIVNYASGAVATVLSGESKYIYLTNNTTSAGNWQVFTFGTGTSSADATALAGKGLEAVSGVLNVDFPVTSTASATVLSAAADRGQTYVFTGGSTTCTLPTVSSSGNGWPVVIRNSGTGSITVQTTDAALIDGSSTKVLAPDESAEFICSSAAWYTVGYGRSANFVFTKLVVDVTVGGTITLTSAQASNKLLQFIGTAPGAVTVVVPDVVSIYYVQCSYAGAFTLTLKTASGSGVALNNSDRIIAYCDGVNVVSAQSVTASTSLALTDGSASVPSLYFAADTDTGIYRASTNTVGLAAGGVAGLTVSNVLATAGTVWNYPAGTVSAPSIYLNGESTTGIYRKAANSLGFTISGTERAYINNTGINGVIGAGTANAGTFTSGTFTTLAASTSMTITAGGTFSLTSGTLTLTGSTLNGISTISGTPNFSGAATGQTAAAGTNTTQLATTAFVYAGYIRKTSTTGSGILPSGTTAQRDGSPAAGYIRFNTDTPGFEGYNGTTWGSIGGGGASGGGSNRVFYENDQTVTVNYTITSGKNAMTAGPITIADGITVTVPDGSTWTVV